MHGALQVYCGDWIIGNNNAILLSNVGCVSKELAARKCFRKRAVIEITIISSTGRILVGVFIDFGRPAGRRR